MRLCLQSWRDKHHTHVPSLRDVLVSRVKSWRTCVRNRDNKTCRWKVVLECGSAGGIVKRPCGTLACTVDTGTSLCSATVWKDYSTIRGFLQKRYWAYIMTYTVTHEFTRSYTLACIHYIHTFIHTYIYTYICTCPYIHTCLGLSY